MAGVSALTLRLVITSDTHLPLRAKDLPDRLWHDIDRADVVLHAGDWVDAATLDAFEARAARLIAVYGNNDGADLRTRLPLVARATIAGLRFAVVHETGPAVGREARSDSLYPDTDVLVFGHSHIPWDSVTPAGLRLLNPGSPTDRRRQPCYSYLTAEIADGQLRNVNLVLLPARNTSRSSTATTT